MMYSGDRRLLEMGLAVGNAVTTQCRRNNYLKGDSPLMNVADVSSGDELEKLWITWIRDESCKRLAYGSWIRSYLSIPSVN